MLYGYLVPHPPLIVPGIGKGDEIPDTRRAYEEIAAELKEQEIETVVMISPHSLQYDDFFHIAPEETASGDFGHFGAANIRFSVEYDRKLAENIEKLTKEHDIPAEGIAGQSKLDHGIMVPLYFLQPKRILRVSPSGLSLLEHYRFGMCIGEAIKSSSHPVAVVASGDMSHVLKEDGPYGFAPEGPEFDAFVCDSIRRGDVAKLMSIDPKLSDAAAQCGLGCLVILLGALDGMKLKSRILTYEGPYGVGYLTASFSGDGKGESLWAKMQKNKEEQSHGQRR